MTALTSEEWQVLNVSENTTILNVNGTTYNYIELEGITGTTSSISFYLGGNTTPQLQINDDGVTAQIIIDSIVDMSDQRIENLGDPVNTKDAVTLKFLSDSLKSIIQDRDYFQGSFNAIGATLSDEMPLVFDINPPTSGGFRIYRPPTSNFIWLSNGVYQLSFILNTIFKRNTGPVNIEIYSDTDPTGAFVTSVSELSIKNPAASIGKIQSNTSGFLTVNNTSGPGQYYKFLFTGLQQTVQQIQAGSQINIESIDALDNLLKFNLNVTDIVQLEGTTNVSITNLQVDVFQTTSTITANKGLTTAQQVMSFNSISNEIYAWFTTNQIPWPIANYNGGISSTKMPDGTIWTLQVADSSGNQINPQILNINGYTIPLQGISMGYNGTYP